MNRKIVWLTGGGTGIGKALAEQLYRQGHWVAISGRRAEVLQQAAKAITAGASGMTSTPGDIWAFSGDVGDPAYVASVHQQIRSKWGEVDWLINNAAINLHHGFLATTPEEYAEHFRVNDIGPILCMKAVLPAMLARRSGSIVNVSSILGRWASAQSSAYSMSKYALAGITDSLRQEIADSGVHVMGVYPGFIVTPMTEQFVTPGSHRARMGRSPEAMARAILNGIERRKREVMFPWYVAVTLHLHAWFPGLMEKVRRVYEQ
jgi:short-subunit dehydrogenase